MANRAGTINLGVLVVALVGVVLAWLGLGYVASTMKEPGIFGDMFGAANALFSGLAFAVLIYTMYLQREELSLQREELQATRTELEGQKIQLQKQVEILRVQSFENTFFQLLRLHSEMVSAIEVPSGPGGTKKGRESFEVFFVELRRNWKAVQVDDELQRLQMAYQMFYDERQALVGHYFRSLYNIYKLVDQSEVADKHIYTNVIRAQLSTFELLLLFYNCLSHLGVERFKPLIESYAVLKTVSMDRLFSNDHLRLYDERAFGKSNSNLVFLLAK